MATLPSNSFVERLMVLLDAQRLRSAMSVCAMPIEGLQRLPVHSAADLLQKHIANIYVPTEQGFSLVQRVLQTGLAHAITAYPDIQTYIRHSQSSDVQVDHEPVTWLATGLAGVGKTASRLALGRLLSDPPAVRPSVHVPERPILGGVFVRVESRIVQVQVVNQLAAQLGLQPAKSGKISSELVSAIRVELYRQGVMFILVDEQQAIAAGATAGASFVKFIGFLRSFGVPVIVIGNFSMCHGLLKQPSQDRQRLLNDPFIMLPDAADDPDYIRHLEALVATCNGLLSFEPAQAASDINHLTGGISRALIQLISIAYRQQREQVKNGAKVRIDVGAMQQAYRTEAFSAFRSEVEGLRTHLLAGTKIANDLTCPFVLSGESAEQQERLMRSWRKAAVARQMMESSITPDERAAMGRGEMEVPEVIVEPALGSLMAAGVSKTVAKAVSVKPHSPSPRPTRKSRPMPSVADASRGWG